MQTYQHYINGQFVDPRAGVWFDTENPYTGEAWAKIPRGDADDVDCAVAAAKVAFEGVWGQTGPTQRGKLLVKLAEIIDAKRCSSEIEVCDNGKLIAEMERKQNILQMVSLLWRAG